MSGDLAWLEVIAIQGIIFVALECLSLNAAYSGRKVKWWFTALIFVWVVWFLTYVDFVRIEIKR